MKITVDKVGGLFYHTNLVKEDGTKSHLENHCTRQEANKAKEEYEKKINNWTKAGGKQ